MYALFSVLLGVLTALMVALNGELAARVGSYVSGGIVHFTGLVLITAVLIFTRANSPLSRRVSPILLGGGAVGYLTVVLANLAFIRVGVSLTLALGLLGQTVSALAADHYGRLGAKVVPFDRRKIGSLALIVAGIAVMASA